MANLIVKDPPEFTEEICAVTEADKITAELENRIKAALLNNDVFLKEALGVLLEAVNGHIEAGEIHVTEQDKQIWNAKAGTAEATQSEPGLMSAGDKKKLDGMAEKAEVNQNAFSSINAGNATIAANSKSAALTLEAGDNITISADNATKKVTIKANRDDGNANTLGGHPAAHFAAADHRHIQGDNWRQGTDLPSTYPKGETIFFSNNPTNKFNGFTYCTVHTIKGYSDNVPACIQFIYPYNDHADKYYFREALYNNNTWRSWYEVITSANIGSQTVTSATKATQDGNGRTIASTYLPLAGGTMTGEIGMSIDRSIKWNNKDNASTPALFMMIPDIVNTTGARMVIYPFGWSTIDNVLKGFCIGEKYHNGPLTIASEYDKMYDIGTSGNRFNNIYAETGTIQTSDRKQKKDIKEFDENFIRAFIMGLIPVSYMYKQNSSGRIHYGLIAQDVEDLMDTLDMDSKDFAGFIKSPKYETITEEIEVENEVISKDRKKKIVKEKRYDTKSILVENEYEYALRYEEFIAPIIKMLQILNNKLDSQQEEIGKLKMEIEALKAR